MTILAHMSKYSEGNFTQLVQSLTLILVVDIANQTFQACVVDTLNLAVMKRFGLVSFLGGPAAPTVGQVLPDLLSDMLPAALLGLKLPIPKKAKSEADMRRAYRAPDFSLKDEYLRALRVARPANQSAPWSAAQALLTPQVHPGSRYRCGRST